MRIAFSTSSPSIGGLAKKFRYLSSTERQETPELLGWRIYDTIAKPWPVPTYEWQADATFSRAWVIQMQVEESDWPVRSVESIPTHVRGELRFTIHRKGGGSDHVVRRFPGRSPIEFQGDRVTGDLAVLCTDATGENRFRLELKDGEDAVAKSSRPDNTTPITAQ